jgi:hypothetical protein
MWWETSLFSLFQLRSPARTRAEVKATATINSSTRYATRRERFVIFTVMLFSPLTATGINKIHPILVPRELYLSNLLKAYGASWKNCTQRKPQLHQESPNEGSAHSLTPNPVFLCAPPVPNRFKTINWT